MQDRHKIIFVFLFPLAVRSFFFSSLNGWGGGRGGGRRGEMEEKEAEKEEDKDEEKEESRIEVDYIG